MSDIFKLLSVNLDEVYCMRKNCACKTLSVDLYALSSKVEECCEHMTVELSTINEKIDFLSGKINEISNQLSNEDEPLPPTIFAYSDDNPQVTVLLRQKGVWKTEPFPGYISSADTEMMMKLSAVMNFDFPVVAELENYKHEWDSETIKVGTTNYCSYSEMQYEGIVILDFNYVPNHQMPNSEPRSIYVAEKDGQCLINAKIIPMDIQSEIIGEGYVRLSAISSYTDPEELDNNNKVYVFGQNGSWITYRPMISNYRAVYGEPIVKDGKKYFGITYAMSTSEPGKVGEFKPNAESQYLDFGITRSELPGPFDYEGQLKYEAQVFIQGLDYPIQPTIYNNNN